MLVRIVLCVQSRIIDRMKRRYFLKNVAEHGEDITLCDPDLRAIAGYNRIHLGSHIFLGPKTRIMCTEADVTIDDYVVFGPEVTIITGDHRIDEIGKYMCEVTEKKPENDQPVHIHRDVWIGARAIILKGVDIGEGSVVAAGAVVTDDIPPYSVFISKHKIIPRFSDAELEKHLEVMKKREKKLCQESLV